MSYELTLRWYVGVGEHDYKVDTTKPQIVFPNTISALAYLAATHSEDFFEESVEHLVCGDIVWMNDNIGFALDSEDVTSVVSDDYTGKIPPGFDQSLGRPHRDPIGDAVKQARGDEAVPQSPILFAAEAPLMRLPRLSAPSSMACPAGDPCPGTGCPACCPSYDPCGQANCHSCGKKD